MTTPNEHEPRSIFERLSKSQETVLGYIHQSILNIVLVLRIVSNRIKTITHETAQQIVEDVIDIGDITAEAGKGMLNGIDGIALEAHDDLADLTGAELITGREDQPSPVTISRDLITSGLRGIMQLVPIGAVVEQYLSRREHRSLQAALQEAWDMIDQLLQGQDIQAEQIDMLCLELERVAEDIAQTRAQVLALGPDAMASVETYGIHDLIALHGEESVVRYPERQDDGRMRLEGSIELNDHRTRFCLDDSIGYLRGFRSSRSGLVSLPSGIQIDEIDINFCPNFRSMGTEITAAHSVRATGNPKLRTVPNFMPPPDWKHPASKVDFSYCPIDEVGTGIVTQKLVLLGTNVKTLPDEIDIRNGVYALPEQTDLRSHCESRGITFHETTAANYHLA